MEALTNPGGNGYYHGQPAGNKHQMHGYGCTGLSHPPAPRSMGLDSYMKFIMSKIFLVLVPILTCAMLLVTGCAEPAPDHLQYAVSIHPLKAILDELTEGRAEVTRLVPPGASPHTYEPRPGDARKAANAAALFHVNAGLDGWITQIAARRHVAIADLLPESVRRPWTHDAHDHDHGHSHEAEEDFNPHFWSDPQTVQAVLPALVEILSEIDPEGAETYAQNAVQFQEELLQLDQALRGRMAAYSGRPVAQFHPSWDYFFHRYALPVAAVIEPFPGKEATPKYLKAIIDTLANMEIAALCTEPQLPKRPALVVAEAYQSAHPGQTLALCEIDPIGGVAGRETYAELLLYNTAQLEAALQ